MSGSEDKVQRQAARLLDRVEIRYGRSSRMRRRLLPIVIRILTSGAEREERQGMLRLVVDAYTSHMRAQEKIEELRLRLRDRLNRVYGELLGIEPPHVG